MRTLSACLLLGLAACLAIPGFAAAPPAPAETTDSVGDPLPKGAIARLGTARFRMTGPSYQALALSPDGKLVATYLSGVGRPRIALIDTTTGRETSSIATNTYGNTLQFTPDGKELVSTNYTGAVIFYDVAQGKESRQVKVQNNRADVFALSGDASLLASCERAYGKKVTVALHEVKTAKQVATLEPIHNGQIGLSMSHDGKFLAANGSAYFSGGGNAAELMKIARTVQVWDAKTGKEYKRLEVAPENVSVNVTATAFSPDNKTLAVSLYGELQLWDFTQGKKLKTWRAPSRSAGVGGLIYSPDGKFLVIASRGSEGAPAVWEVATGKRLLAARPPECFLQAVGFRGGRVIAIGVRSQSLVVWDVVSGKRFDSEVGHSAPIAGAFVRGRHVYTASNDGQVIAWTSSGKQIEAMSTPGDRRGLRYGSSTATATFSPDASTLAISENYGPVSVRAIKSGEELYTLQRNNDSSPPAYSRDGKYLAVPAYDVTKRKSSVRILQADSGEELLEFDPGAGVIAGLAFDPSGKRLMVCQGSENNNPSTVLAWRIDTNKQDENFKKHEMTAARGFRMAMPLVYSPDGETLAVSSGLAGVVELLDGATGKPGRTITTGGQVLLPPVFSPDGRTLALAMNSNSTHQVAIWELGSGKKRWEATVPSQPTALTFDHTGQVLVSGHQDTTALVWDVSGRNQTGKTLDAAGWDAVVKDLGADDPAKAFAAQKTLSGSLAVAELRQRLKAAEGKALGEKEIAKLVKDLDDDDPDVRGKAYDDLEEQGKAAEAALKKALESKPSAEVRRSANALLAKIKNVGVAPEIAQATRAVEVLEWIGNAEAKSLLADLAKGRAAAPLTQEAKAALSRLSAR